MVDQNQKFKLFIAHLVMNLGIILMLLPLSASVVAIVADNGTMVLEGCSGRCEKGPYDTCRVPAWNPCSGDGGKCNCTESVTILGDCPCGYHPYGQK